MLYINVQSTQYGFLSSICYPIFFSLFLYYFAIKETFVLFPLRILFPGAFISTSSPVISALLRSLMSGTLGLILFHREQEKAGYASTGFPLELCAFGWESREIERREGNAGCIHRKPTDEDYSRRGEEVGSSRIPDCGGISSKTFIFSWVWWNLNCMLSRKTSTLMKGIDTVSAFLPQYEYIPKSAVKK